MDHQPPEIVSLQGIGQRFGNLVTALRDVNLRIVAGEFVAVTGTSGSGKSTLLHILGLLARPTEGRLTLAGYDTNTLRDRDLANLRARSIGFVFQAFHLVPHLNVLENVIISLSYKGTPDSDRHEAAVDALAAVGMLHRLGAFPATLSGGEQQRVAIARAVVRRPKLLLCDEPTGNLDTTNTDAVMDLLEQTLTPDRALVVVTHDASVARRALRTVRLRDGEIVQSHEARI